MELKSPLHINAGSESDGMRKTLKIGNLVCIPGSSLKGKLRDNFRKVIDADCKLVPGKEQDCDCPVCVIFGGSGYMPSRLNIDNLKPDNTEVNTTIRSTVSIDRFRKVAKDGALVFSEAIDKCVFKGTMQIFFTSETEKYEGHIIIALKMIDSIGHSKSRGFGFVETEVRKI